MCCKITLTQEDVNRFNALENISKTHQTNIDKFMKENNFIYAERETISRGFDYYFTFDILESIMNGEILEYKMGKYLKSLLSQYERNSAYAYKIYKNEDNQVITISLLEVVQVKPISENTKNIIIQLFWSLDIIEIEVELFILEAGQKTPIKINPIALQKGSEETIEETPF